MQAQPPDKQAQFGWVGTTRCRFMKTNEKKLPRRMAPRHVGRMVETVIGCKWSLTVLDLVERDISRPGEMERSIEGLTAKVLNDCLRRLVQFGVLEKRSYPEIPPRVEYGLTEFGRKFERALDVLDALEADFEAARGNTERTSHTATPSTERTTGADER